MISRDFFFSFSFFLVRLLFEGGGEKQTVGGAWNKKRGYRIYRRIFDNSQKKKKVILRITQGLGVLKKLLAPSRRIYSRASDTLCISTMYPGWRPPKGYHT